MFECGEARVGRGKIAVSDVGLACTHYAYDCKEDARARRRVLVLVGYSGGGQGVCAIGQSIRS